MRMASPGPTTLLGTREYTNTGSASSRLARNWRKLRPRNSILPGLGSGASRVNSPSNTGPSAARRASARAVSPSAMNSAMSRYGVAATPSLVSTPICAAISAVR